jgi:hypothetical protein
MMMWWIWVRVAWDEMELKDGEGGMGLAWKGVEYVAFDGNLWNLAYTCRPCGFFFGGTRGTQLPGQSFDGNYFLFLPVLL